MKKKEVYEKSYKGEKTEEYYQILGELKKDSFDDICPERGYLSFDGDFMVRVSTTLLNKYYKKTNTAKMTIEKIGPDVNKESKIEKMLLEKGFKKIVEEK